MIETDTRTARISSSTRTCYSCAVKNMKELAFQYRSDISNDDLPGTCNGYISVITPSCIIDGVTCRPNCHWGRNCRTQVHNRIHAEWVDQHSYLLWLWTLFFVGTIIIFVPKPSSRLIKFLEIKFKIMLK